MQRYASYVNQKNKINAKNNKKNVKTEIKYYFQTGREKI